MTTNKKRCKICVNCELVNRWEMMYRDHLEKHPQNKDTIDIWRGQDDLALTCLRNQYEKD